MMITDYTGNCPICGAMLRQIDEFPLTVSCPTGHYKMCMSTSASTTMPPPTALPCKSDVEVPKAFRDAFADKEVLEP